MNVEQHCRNGVLKLKLCDRALVEVPDWQSIGGLTGARVSEVVLDLGGAEFISSLFLQACVELDRRLTASGSRLLLLHFEESQRLLLELVDGAAGLIVLEDEEELEQHRRDRSEQDDRPGVNRSEKLTLWS